MTPSEAVNFFGDRTTLAEVCEVTPTAVYQWVRKGAIPYDKQCLIQIEAAKPKWRKLGRRTPVARRADAAQVAA